MSYQFYRCTTPQQKRSDYINWVVPTLVGLGYDEQDLVHLFDKRQVRLRWGDWSDFTVYMTNPLCDDTWYMDELVHALWSGASVRNRLVMTCFLPAKGVGPLSSAAIIDLHTLAYAMKKYGVTRETNRYNKTTFITLPFSHPALYGKIWRISNRPI